MAYPEPTPDLTGKEAKEFLKRLETLDLTDRQKALYADARELYRKLKPRE